jgi:hypothetical protein
MMNCIKILEIGTPIVTYKRDKGMVRRIHLILKALKNEINNQE